MITTPAADVVAVFVALAVKVTSESAVWLVGLTVCVIFSGYAVAVHSPKFSEALPPASAKPPAT